MQLLFAAWLLSVDAFLLQSRPSCVVRSRAADSDDDFRLRSSETVSLKDMWDRALTLQRAGQLDEALDAYEDFLSAADQNGVPPASTAEALGNVGAIHLRRKALPAARASLEASLEHRELGSTLANLAIAALQAGATALMTVSLLPQIVLNFQRRSGGQWSAITAGLSVGGNAIRAFTTLTLTKDTLLLCGFLLGLALNATLLGQILLYAS